MVWRCGKARRRGVRLKQISRLTSRIMVTPSCEPPPIYHILCSGKISPCRYQGGGQGEAVMSLYNIVNMSDPYTIEAVSLDVAFVACLFLGSGQYAFEQLDGKEGVPLFIFGGTEEWCREHLNEGF